MSMRARFNRTVFTAPVPAGGLDALLAQLEGEDVELVLDARPQRDDELAARCARASTYYVHRDVPEAVVAARERPLADAARLALRHRTCVLADGPTRAELAAAIADTGGMRVIDLHDSPAPIAVAGLSGFE